MAGESKFRKIYKIKNRDRSIMVAGFQITAYLSERLVKTPGHFLSR